MDYWKEAFVAALEEAGMDVPPDDKSEIAARVLEGAEENYGMAMGYHCIPNPENEVITKLKTKVTTLEAQVDKERSNFIKNVAMRHNVDTTQVTLEGNGHATVWP